MKYDQVTIANGHGRHPVALQIGCPFCLAEHKIIDVTNAKPVVRSRDLPHHQTY